MKFTADGQTLLESLLAIAIILIGIVSLASLLINVMSNSRVALAETRVTQLAQEALEGARYVRDSNWLKREDGVLDSTTGRLIDYAQGLRGSSGDTTAIYLWNPDPAATPDAAITFNFTAANAITDAAAIVYQDTSGYFRHATGTVPSDWKNTGFQRLVTFEPICFDTTETDLSIAETVESSSCSAGTIEVGLQTTVQISWVSSGVATQRNFVEKIYNWKYADPTVIP